MRQKNRIFLAIVLPFWMLHLATVSIAKGQDQPNILYLMSDDHAVTAIGADGGRLAPLDPTPTLDQLVDEGMVLENTFCNNSVCSPSRASILTGQYSHIHGTRSLGGKVEKDQQRLPLEATYYRYWMHMKHHYNPAHFGIRTKQWKLIFCYGVDEKPGKSAAPTPPAWELYDLNRDPLEINNLYGNSQYTEIADHLKKQLKAARAEVNDSDADYPHITEIVARHWDGGEQEAIRISHEVAANPVNAQEKSGDKSHQ